MKLLRNVMLVSFLACFSMACADDSRSTLLTKSYYSMSEKDHVLYDALHQESLYFSDLDLFSIGDCNGQYDEAYEKAFSYYQTMTANKRVTRSGYYYYIKKMAEYLYDLLFAVDETDGIGTSPVTKPLEFTGNYAAMLVGIDYQGTANQLSNCIHDVEHVVEKLLVPKMGIKESSMILMTDNQSGDLYPTGANMRKQFKKFANRLNYARNGYFHYSGHGTYMRDDDNDESDGKDEALCPVDCNRNGMIRDDELFDDFICELGHDVKLVMTTDCCHSGSIMDLPYKWYKSGNYVLQQKRMSVKDLDALPDVIMISGCKDSQTSADGGFMKDDTKGSGAMTAAYLETLDFYNHNLTYRQLIEKMHELLRYHGYAQKPELSSTRIINLDDMFMSSRAAMRP